LYYCKWNVTELSSQDPKNMRSLPNFKVCFPPDVVELRNESQEKAGMVCPQNSGGNY